MRWKPRVHLPGAGGENTGSSGLQVTHRGGTEDAAVLYPLVHELLCGEERFGNLTAEARRAQSKSFH